MAAAADTRADYIRTRSQSDTHYARLVLDFLTKFGSASRKDIDDLLWSTLSDALDDKQKRSKISNLLSKMRGNDQIRNDGTRQRPRWVLA